MLKYGDMLVPWNAAWTGEEAYEVRNCRWVENQLALWSPHKPGVGKPVFAKPHAVRQRQSIRQWRCTVCGEMTPQGDRWWFKLGNFIDAHFMTTEAPVHRACGELALKHCPHLKGRENYFTRLPSGYSIVYNILGGPATDRDFGVKIGNRRVIGSLKIAWPASRFRVDL